MFMNLGPAIDGAAGMVFNDLVHTARVPGSPEAPYDGKFLDKSLCDPDGWPLSDFGLVLADFTDLPQPSGHLTGSYLLSFEGQADVAQVLSGSTAIEHLSDVNGRRNYRVKCGSDVTQLFLQFRNVKGVRAMSLIPEGSGFHAVASDFARKALAPFDGIRVMDLQRINNAPDTGWSDRALLSHAPNGPARADEPWNRGKPLELLVALALDLEKDLWLCVPHGYELSDIKAMAGFLAPLWPGRRRLFVQWSNEAGWNSLFNVSGWLQKKFNSDWDQIKAFIGTRTAEIATAFRDAGVANVVPVLCGQFANPDWIQSGLKAIETVYGPPSQIISGIAAASYVTKVDDIPAHAAIYQQYHQIAGQSGLDFMLYELGIEQATLETLRDSPDVVPLVNGLVDAWNKSCPSVAAKVACWYVLDGGGYAALLYPDQTTATYSAVATAAAADDAPKEGTVITRTAEDLALGATLKGGGEFRNGRLWMGLGSRVPLHAPKDPGRYRMSLRVQWGRQDHPPTINCIAIGTAPELTRITPLTDVSDVEVGTVEVPAMSDAELVAYAGDWGWYLDAVTYERLPDPVPAPPPTPTPAPEAPKKAVRMTLEYSDGSSEIYALT